jgi:hypothetical protein
VASLERLVLVVPDDAFYYLQIARNLVATGRSTANGLSATNGYHPLWLAVMTAFAAVVPDRELLLRAADVPAARLADRRTSVVGGGGSGG